MPIHDWTRVRANRFHDFHQRWTVAISDALNEGLLPSGYFALVEQVTAGPEPDVVTLSLPGKARGDSPPGIAVEEALPKVRHVAQAEAITYARKANRVTVRHPDGAVVATSANLPGGVDPRRVEEVPAEIAAAADVVVDGGVLPGTPSTVIDVTGSEPIVLREGAVPFAEALVRLRGLTDR